VKKGDKEKVIKQPEGNEESADGSLVRKDRTSDTALEFGSFPAHAIIG
jgi:hypothetical protein